MTNTASAAPLIRLEAGPGRSTIAECFQCSYGRQSRIGNYSVVRSSHEVFHLGHCRCFPHQPGRETHLQARIAAAMLAECPELFGQLPAIEMIDVLTSKLHG